MLRSPNVERNYPQNILVLFLTSRLDRVNFALLTRVTISFLLTKFCHNHDVSCLFPFALHNGSCEEVSSLALLLHSSKSLLIRSGHFTFGFLDILTTRGSSAVLYITNITRENCLSGPYFVECSSGNNDDDDDYDENSFICHRQVYRAVGYQRANDRKKNQNN